MAAKSKKTHQPEPETATPNESRDSIKDIWGARTPYKHGWPQRCITETLDKWVQSACVLCSNGCELDIGVKDGKVVGVRGRVSDRVNIGRLGPKGLNADGNTRLCTATAAACMWESFGCDGRPGSYSDIDYTDCLFMVGHNVAHTQTVLWARILDRLNGPNPPALIVVDPRKSETATRATVHLAAKSGTNLALLNGLQHLLFENDWIDEEFVSKHVVGIDALRKMVDKYTPDYVEKITGVPKAKLEEAAKIIGTTPSLLSTALQGVYQSNQATASACQINNINLLLGKIAVDPPGEAKADLDIWLDFSKRMDFKNKDGEPLIPYTHPEEVFEAWKRMSFDRPLDCSALSYEKLTGGSGMQWPCTAKCPQGKELLFEDGKIFTDAEYCESFGHDLETGAPYTKP
ncbi:hypothetical protein ACJ73_04203 [Blastomyces percursus]|uniref:4Fe-4S Mo/W bis-MGD-type domain-containing protein n=1 Tax=Blastomyces percursus TaxID=1658174 RepID=A0A1J9R8X1_9EURO|nr:hypothetical protein ACJ73_04203 [Blastomyces percursus]